MSKIVNIKTLPYQTIFADKALNDATVKYLGFIAGTGTGKTYLMPRLLYAMMNKWKGEEWIVSAPSIQMLKNNPIAYTARFFQSIGLDFFDHFHKSDKVYESELGKIHFISAETPDRMQGIHAKAILGDEAGLFKIVWWLTAVQRVSFKKGKVLLFTTPYNLNWLKTEVFDKWLQKDKNFFVINPRSIDNPFYPKEEYYNAKKRLPDWKFRMLYEAQFSKPYGLIYPEYTTCAPFKIPANWPRYGGADHGFNDPFTVIKIAHDLDKDLYYAYEEHYQTGMMPEEMIEVLKKEDIPYYIDPENKTLNEYFKRKSINVRIPDKSVMSGLIATNAILKTGKLIIFDSLKCTIDEINSYQYALDKNENLIDKPQDGNDHLMDALRYVVNTAITLKDNSKGIAKGSSDLDHREIDIYSRQNEDPLKGFM
jgi:phage terminase large subunit